MSKKVFVFFIISIAASCAYSQYTLVHDTARVHTTATFRQLSALPPDTARHPHAEPDEDDDKPRHFPLKPGGTIFSDTSHHTSGNNRGAQSPSPAINFRGSPDNTVYIPPDVQGAAGPTDLMEMLNGTVKIFTKTGSAIDSTTLFNFWSTLSPSGPFDPRITYDPYGKRWIAVADDHSSSANSCFYLAVSQNTDPTGTWDFYKIDADASDTAWLDFPTLGFNKNWIVVTGNMFGNAAGGFQAVKIWMFNKANAYAGTSTYTMVNYGNQAFTLQPAITYDSAVATEYMMMDVDGDYDGSNGAIGLYSITGAVGSESVNFVSYATSSTPWGSDAGSTNTAPQLGSTKKIDMDDSRMQSVVYRNGYIWGTQNVYFPPTAPTRVSVQWWQLGPTGTINQHALIDDATGVKSYAYPSISVNSYNDALIGYSSFDSLQYASADYSYRTSCDNLSTLESDYIYQAGQSSYFKTFSGTANRWGDYSATCVDPTNDENFWTLVEYASPTTNNWATWWAEVNPTHNANGGAGTWTWTGIKSTSWFEPCNWDKGSLPDGSSDVVIPGGTTFNPTITGSAASCKTITVATSSGAILTVNDSGGGSLSVSQ